MDSKILVYTIITNNYDTLRPFKREDGFDYVCFTDNMDMESNGWTLEEVEIVPDMLKFQRSLKIKSNYLLEEMDMIYEKSIYMDANFRIVGSLNEFLERYYKGGILTVLHDKRTLLTDEAKQIIRLRKDTVEKVTDHMRMLQFMKVPDDCGMYANGFMVRDESIDVDIFETAWNDLLLLGSHRDQLSCGPAAWVTGTKINTVTRRQLNEYVILERHKPYIKTTHANRCCGRCDGNHDVCVADTICENHNIRGCEKCFGKRSI